MSEEVSTIFDKLEAVQHALKAPKDGEGRFGKSRSAEAILAALKPLLHEHRLVLIMVDDIVEIAGRHYVKSVVTIASSTATADQISAVGYAWEGDLTPANDASQMTGKASSYARKYALGGLFVIDDTKDVDFDEEAPRKPTEKPRPANTVAADDPAPAILKARIAAALRGVGVEKENMQAVVMASYGLELTSITAEDAQTLLAQIKENPPEVQS